MPAGPVTPPGDQRSTNHKADVPAGPVPPHGDQRSTNRKADVPAGPVTPPGDQHSIKTIKRHAHRCTHVLRLKSSSTCNPITTVRDRVYESELLTLSFTLRRIINFNVC